MKRFEDTIRILLADEHLLVRSAISCLIGTFDNMMVVAEVDSEQQLMKEAAHYQADVALIDAAVVSLKGLESLSRLTALSPASKRSCYPITIAIILFGICLREALMDFCIKMLM